MNRACFSKGHNISSILRGLIRGISNLDKAEFSQWRAFFTKRFEIATITLATCNQVPSSGKPEYSFSPAKYKSGSMHHLVGRLREGIKSQGSFLGYVSTEKCAAFYSEKERG